MSTFSSTHPLHSIIPRRTLLKLACSSVVSTGLGLTAACSRKNFFNPENDIVLSGGQVNNADTRQWALIAINLTLKEKKITATPFLPHGIIIDPHNKYQLLCFEKNGTHACHIDLKQQQVLHEFNTDEGYLFSGHATFSHDGKRLYSIEINLENKQGIIHIRDGRNFSSIKKLPTLGLLPHDCLLRADNQLFVSNTGRSASGFHQPSIVHIDLTTEKLIERITLDEANLNCTHFRFTDSNDLVIASAPVDTELSPNGGVTIKRNGHAAVTMKQPDAVIRRMQGQALGIAIAPQSGMIAITHPDANLLTFWSLQKQAIIKAIGIENPRGICLSQNNQHFIISYGNKQPAMAKISSSSLTPLSDSILQQTQTRGEILLNWSKTIKQIMPSQVYD